MEELVQALNVLAALTVTLVVPPLAAVRRMVPRGAGGMAPLIALALGCASQGLLGLFWNRLVRGLVYGEIAFYYGFWIVASLLAVWIRRPREKDSLEYGELWLLILTLTAAVLVRSLHPLEHAALGQSDAYSHLQFIRQVMADGMIHNQIYPPAFTWIMALPATTFGLDPYWLARFGGAFWGTGLTLALFALGRCKGRPWAGLCAAALAAFCPAWMPLLKTGVGVFANQLGLFFSALDSALLFAKRLETRLLVPDDLRAGPGLRRADDADFLCARPSGGQAFCHHDPRTPLLAKHRPSGVSPGAGLRPVVLAGGVHPGHSPGSHPGNGDWRSHEIRSRGCRPCFCFP